MPAPAAAPVRPETSSIATEEDAPASALVTDNPGAPIDDGAPVGPNDGEESAFLAEQRAQGFVSPAAPRGAKSDAAEDDADSKVALPPLDELVNRIPPETRQLMEELFRAKFVTVKRIPKTALK